MLTKAILLCIVGVCFANAIKVGGEVDVDPNDETINNLLQKAIAAENAKGKLSEPQEIVQVFKATRKVTSGNIYKISYASQGIYSGNRIQCEISLHSRPWISDQPSVLGIQCVPGAKYI